MSRIPPGPMIVSALIVLAGALYLLFRPTQIARSKFYDPPGPGIVRVVSWNIDCFPSAAHPSLSGVAAKRVSGILNKLHATVVFLQGMASRQQAETIATALAGEWVFEAVVERDQSNRFLALLVRQSTSPIQRHLIRLANGHRALAYNVGGDGKIWQFICIRADSPEAHGRQEHIQDLIYWVKDHPASLTVLGGSFDAPFVNHSVVSADSRDAGQNGETHRRLLEWFLDCNPAGVTTVPGEQHVSRVYAAPKQVSVIRSAVVTGGALNETGCLPLVVDLRP